MAYRNLQAARAAFAAGPAAYRCQVCGGEHVSGRGEGQACLDRLFEENRWRIPLPSVYLGAVAPSLHFVKTVWERERAAGRAAMRACFEEPLLAMRPFRHIPRDVYERIQDTVWHLRQEYPSWSDANENPLLQRLYSLERAVLNGGRPPAQVKDISYSMAVSHSRRLPGVRAVSGWTVIPAIPGPRGETEVTCSPENLDLISMGLGNPLSSYVLLGLRYGSQAFVAVFAETYGEEVAPDPLVVVREEYGCSPQEHRIALGRNPTSTIEETLHSAGL